MSNSITDVKVSISAEKVIRSAEFGIPLLYQPTDGDSIVVDYTECYDLDEVTNEVKSCTKSAVICEQAKYIFNAENAPEKVAVLCCPTSMLANYENYDWRQLIINCTSDSEIETAKTVASIIEGMEIPKLMYVEYGGDTSESFNNLDYVKKFADFTRVVFMYTQSEAVESCDMAYPNASALIGETSAKAIGSYTYKNIYLPDNVQVYENMKSSQLEELHNAGGMCVVRKAGYNVTSEGKTTGGEYIDIIDAIDWVTTNIEYAIQQALIINDKIAYTDSGINYLATLVTNVLQKATVNGMINTLDSGIGDYTVDFPGRASTEKEDRQARKYKIGTFEFAVAGAIHTVVVKGTLTY